MHHGNRTRWASPRPQENRLPEQTRRQRDADPGYRHRPGAQVATPGEAPHNVSYEDESSGAYVVREPDAREVVVPKARTAVEQSSIEDRQTAFAGRLVRWSAFALVGVVLGGIGGVVLGLPAVIVTAAQLTGHSQRVRRWRSEHPEPNGPLPLPAPATTERLRLLTAFWQALLALAFGVVVFAFLTGRVL